MKKKQSRTLKVVIDVTKLESIAEIPQVVEGIEERRQRIEDIKLRGWV